MRTAGLSFIVPLLKDDTVFYQDLLAWTGELRYTKWKNLNEVQRDYPSAKKAGRNRLQFLFPGGMTAIVQYHFSAGSARIHFAGTEKEWQRMNAKKEKP